MFAMLRDKTGRSIGIEVLEAAEQPATPAEDGARVYRYEIRSPLPVVTPERYQFEMRDGTILEGEVVYCRARPDGTFYLLALVSAGVTSLVA